MKLGRSQWPPYYFCQKFGAKLFPLANK